MDLQPRPASGHRLLLRRRQQVSTKRNAGALPTEGVRSVERVLDLLEHMADAGGQTSLSELAAGTGLPLPTIFRLMRTLVNRGYVRQAPSRRYALGPALVPLGETANRLLGAWARPKLTRLVETVGETANLAMLEGDAVVYVAQVPSRHSMRMFTEVGRRVSLHSTGVGKALLAQLPADDVRALIDRTGLPALTSHTITEPAALWRELNLIRRQGYAVDHQEQELGVRCVAVPVPGSPIPAAISVSGPNGRLTAEAVPRIAAVLTAAAADLLEDRPEEASAG